MADVRIKYTVDKGELVLAREELEKIEKEIGVTEKKSKGLSKEFKIVGGAIAAAFTVDKLIDFGKQVISITAEFQKLKAVLTNTLGSRSAADQAFKNIQDFASKTPFQVNQLTDSFVKLANQGFVPTTKELRKLGDLAASTGKEFDQLTEAIIDAQVGEFERLKEFGIRAQKEGDNVTFTFKGVQTQTEFTSDAIRDYILSLGDAVGVSGSMAAISETLGGKLSNMQDNIDALFYAIGQQFNPVVGGAIDLINNFIGSITDYINTPYVDNLREQQTEINTLVGALTKLNEGDEVRNTLIGQLNAKYPEFLSSLDQEKLTNEDIANRLLAVNEQFRIKIELETVNLALEDKKQKAAELYQKQAEINLFLEEARNATEQERALFADVIEAKEKQLIRVEEERNAIIDELTTTQEEYAKKLREAGGELEFFNTKTTTANENSEEAERITRKALEGLEGTIALREKEKMQLVDNSEEQKKRAQQHRESSEKILEDLQNELEARQQVLDFTKEGFSTIIDISTSFNERRIQELEQQKERELAIAGDNAEKKEAVERRFQEKIKVEQRKAAVAQKAGAIFNIGISTAQAVIAALAPPPLGLGPIAGLPFSVSAGILGAAQIAAVAAKPIPKFAKGVLALNGPGGETSDSIYAMLSRGESVMTARETKDFLPTLRAIRENKIDPKLLNSIVQRGPQVIHAVNEVPRDVINIDENGFSKYLVTRQQKSQVLTSKYRT